MEFRWFLSGGDIQLLLQALVSAKLHVMPSFPRLQPYIWTSDYMSININTLVLLILKSSLFPEYQYKDASTYRTYSVSELS